MMIYFTTVQEKIAKEKLYIYNSEGIELEALHERKYMEEISKISLNIELLTGNDELKLNLTNIYKQNVCKHALLIMEGVDPPAPCEITLLNSGLETVLVFVAQKIGAYSRDVGKKSA